MVDAGAIDFKVRSEKFSLKDSPECAGVYLVYVNGALLYVGQSLEISRRILDHKHNSHCGNLQEAIRLSWETAGLFVFGQQACERVTELAGSNAIRALEWVAIQQLKPPLNQRRYSSIHVPKRDCNVVWRKSTYIVEVYKDYVSNRGMVSRPSSSSLYLIV